MESRDAIVVGSVLATAGTAIAAVDRVKETGARSVRFACLLAAKQGVEQFHRYHPDVPLFTLGVDEELTEDGDVFPGLGDFGDRLYGTR
jgi:uracil phosphoribosyltransferase